MIYARHKSVVGPEPLKKKKGIHPGQYFSGTAQNGLGKNSIYPKCADRNMKIIMAPILSLFVTSLGHVIDRLSALCPL